MAYMLYVVHGVIIFTSSHFSLRCQYHYNFYTQCSTMTVPPRPHPSIVVDIAL